MKKKTEYLPETGNIQKAAENFKSWLKEKNFAERTTYGTGKYVTYFLNYLLNENTNINQVAYTDLLDFVNHCRKANLNTAHINRIILSLRDYFNYLIKTNQLTSGNPADGFKLKGEIQKVISDTISKEELERIYHEYQVNGDNTLRRKIILGLLIYQALTLEDINKLETEHVKLREGKIRITGNKQKNGRALKLEPHQILDLQEYILQVRTKLLSKHQEEITRLFLTKRRPYDEHAGKPSMHKTLAALFKQVQKNNPAIKHARQIRASVITDWLKHYNLREVQYMAGHKKVTSTEQYKTENLEELSKALEKFHPLN